MGGRSGALYHPGPEAANDWVAPNPLLVAGLGAITTLGADLTAAVVLSTLALALLIRRRGRLAGYVVVAGVGGAVIAPTLKELVGRLRPVVDAPVATAPGPSFPSGHTLTATLMLLAVVLVGELILFITAAGVVNPPRPPVAHLDAELPPTASFPSGHTGAALCLYGAVAVLVLGATLAWWRWLVVAAAVTAVVLVAVARLYRGAHHPSDVLGSVLLGLPWLLATAYLLGAEPGFSAPARVLRPGPLRAT